MIKQQFLEEWNKLTHTWSVRIVFLLFLTGGIVTAATSDFTGYMAPFMAYNYRGSTGSILFAAIIAGQASGKYQNYSAAKVMALFSLSAFLCLMYTAVLSLICHVTNGTGSGYFSHYPLMVAVFLLCRVLVYWIYIAVFLLIGALVCKKLLAFAISCGVVFLENFLWLEQQMSNGQSIIGGSLTSLIQSEKYIGMVNFCPMIITFCLYQALMQGFLP